MYKYRDIEERLRECLGTFRIVSLTGARQVGKTTLVRRLCEGSRRRYVNLEDPVVTAAVANDPDAWLEANPPPLALDEVQHVPAIFPALKRRVDRDSRPGQYVITGSALWLSMRTIGESLAGRVALLEMWPFRASEWSGNRSFDWEALLGLDRADRFTASGKRDNTAVHAAITRGGYPGPAGLHPGRARQTWCESYLRTYLQRDVLDLSRLERVAEFTRLVRLLAGQTGSLANQSSFSRDLGVPQPTVRRHIEWLKMTYQCHALSPYSTNLGKRLVKTPKIYWSDTGMAAALAGLAGWDAIVAAGKAGMLAETWVVNDLRVWSSAKGGAELFFWRSHGGGEVDALVETNGALTGIEIKLGHRIDSRDLKGLRECQAALGKKFRNGIVLYGGHEVVGLGERLVAVPMTVLLSGSAGREPGVDVQ